MQIKKMLNLLKKNSFLLLSLLSPFLVCDPVEVNYRSPQAYSICMNGWCVTTPSTELHQNFTDYVYLNFDLFGIANNVMQVRFVVRALRDVEVSDPAEITVQFPLSGIPLTPVGLRIEP